MDYRLERLHNGSWTTLRPMSDCLKQLLEVHQSLVNDCRERLRVSTKEQDEDRWTLGEESEFAGYLRTQQERS